jgi:ribose 1,5-bisphosphate isomerase
MNYKIASTAMSQKIPTIIQKTIDDIVAIKIQGATNVALATFITIGEWAKETDITDYHEFKTKLVEYATMLAEARPNEPLAKNGIRFIMNQLVFQYKGLNDVKSAGNAVMDLSNQYVNLIEDSKKRIVEHGLNVGKFADVVFTHCHSSTAEAIIAGINDHHKITAINTETRPLYQGRITSKNLLKAGVKTIMIVDSAAPYFIKDDSFLPVDMVFLGADQISVSGDALNKIGSFSMGLSSYFASKPLYIVTPSLKLDLTTIYNPIKIELRKDSEIWPDAPKELDIINPAFDLVPHQFITGYLTEFGIVKPEELEDKVRRSYEWVS